MTLALNLATRNARLQAIIDQIGSGAEIRLFAGVRPTSGGTETILLATHVLTDPAATVNNAVMTFNPIADDLSADVDGVVSWGRVVDSNGDFVVDFDCGAIASSADMKFSNVNFLTGGVIKVASFKINEGNE